MQSPRLRPIPWDLVVFLSITTVGFALSLQNLRNPMQNVNATPVAGDANAFPTISASNPVWDLGCIESGAARQQTLSDLGAVRIKGKLCTHKNKSRVAQRVRVRNLTNGQEGTIFLKGDYGTFVTDYMLLQSGKNEIQIEWLDLQRSASRRITAEVYER